MKFATRLVVVAGLALACCSPAFAQQGKPAEKGKDAMKEKGKEAVQSGMPQMSPEEMQAMMSAGVPGPEHAKLAQEMVGTWDTVTRGWMAPDTEPMMEMKGTATFKPAMGGRYIVGEYVGGEIMPGQTFRGVATTGYNKISKEYESVWMDNMSCGMMISTGKMENGGISWKGQMDDPMTGKRMPYRMVEKNDGKGTYTLEMYNAGPDGKEFKSMEVVHTNRRGEEKAEKADKAGKAEKHEKGEKHDGHDHKDDEKGGKKGK